MRTCLNARVNFSATQKLERFYIAVPGRRYDKLVAGFGDVFSNV